MTTANIKSPLKVLGRLSAAACAAGLCMASLAAPAGAQVAAVPTATRVAGEEIPPRLERACLRIPNLTTRAQNMLERIAGDAETRGSLAWLDTKIAQAEERGRADLVTALENRRAVRVATVPVLEQQLIRLAALGERCADAGVGG